MEQENHQDISIGMHDIHLPNGDSLLYFKWEWFAANKRLQTNERTVVMLCTKEE